MLIPQKNHDQQNHTKSKFNLGFKDVLLKLIYIEGCKINLTRQMKNKRGKHVHHANH